MLLTGCDSGFGHHLAIGLSKAGFTVFACCLNDQSEGGNKIKSLESSNVDKNIHVIKMDVTKQQEVDDALKYVENNLPKFGLWGLVNNAGVASSGFVEWFSMDQFEKVKVNRINFNYFTFQSIISHSDGCSKIRVTKAFAPLIRKSKGRIVNVSSILGRSSTRASSAYCITKYGMEAFSNVLRREVRQFSVKVCTIQPGNFINTTDIIGGSDVALRNINQLWDDLNVSLQESYGRQCIDDSIALHELMFRLSVLSYAILHYFQ